MPVQQCSKKVFLNLIITGCLPNQGKIREMRVGLKISGKNQGIPLNLEKIREKSGKSCISKMNSSCRILKERVLDIGLKVYISTDLKGFSEVVLTFAVLSITSHLLILIEAFIQSIKV